MAGGGRDRDRARARASCPARGCAPAWSPPAPAPRQPLGLCRARHAAVEASILASRLKWLGAEHVRAELARLQELVDKTAGPRERAAMDYVRALRQRASMTELVVTAPARLHFGMLDPAGLGARRFGGCGVGIESPRVVVRGQAAVRRRGRRAWGAGRARGRVRAPSPRRVRSPGRSRGRRARGDPAAHRARIGHQARPGDRPRRGRAGGRRGRARGARGRERPRGTLQRRVLDVRGTGSRGRGRGDRRRLDQPAGGAPSHARARGGACWRCPAAERDSPATRRSASSASCTSRRPASRASRGCC